MTHPTNSEPASPGPGTTPTPAQAHNTNDNTACSTINVAKIYGSDQAAVAALRDVSVSIPRGRFTAIMGPSGSGKSTLMHVLAGLDYPTQGQVFLGDIELTKMTDTELTLLRRDRVGFIFQAFNLLPVLTAEQNIALPAKLAGKKADPNEIRRIAATLGLEERLSHRPNELSGGQQQRVAIARALLNKPDVLFADEPTGALDTNTGREVLTTMRQAVTDLGQTVVMVTHDPVAASYADEVLLLADGLVAGVIQDPTRESVLQAIGQLGG